jgi:hypothetical protein
MDWSRECEVLADAGGKRLRLRRAGEPVSVRAALEGLASEAALRMLFNDAIAMAPFPELRWEVPRLSVETLETPFECVCLPSPGLTRTPELDAFAAHFEGTEVSVVAFPNLRGDAMLIAPRAETYLDAYTHLGVFVRHAPESQRDALWRVIGETCLTVAAERLVWLSTAGAGVAWLHVRLDTQPKYYAHAPYRDARIGG